ncbi:Sialyltransferase-like protein 5, partial [Mucuna pruriens]
MWLGLTAHIIDHCKLILKYLKGINNTWYNAQFKKFEPLEYNYDVRETILLWKQYWNMTTMLTREYLDACLGGCVDYAPLRIVDVESLTNEAYAPPLPTGNIYMEEVQD